VLTAPCPKLRELAYLVDANNCVLIAIESQRKQSPIVVYGVTVHLEFHGTPPGIPAFPRIPSERAADIGGSLQVSKVIDKALLCVLRAPPTASHVPASEFAMSLCG
jgi:hypothetical protein